MPVLPFAEWMPDRPDLAEATRYASGVIATTTDSYGPVRSLGVFSSNALNGGPCIGMAGIEDINQRTQVFAGAGTNLFLLPYSTTRWSGVSGAPYAPAAGENWRFAQFNEIVLATDFSDPIQSYTLGTSATFGVLSANAPQARHIAVAKTFCIVANTYDPVGGYNPARLWWSASGDPTNWPTPGGTQAQENQSDYNDLLGPQGGITGLAPNLAGCDCAVFFERGVFRMIYVGPPDIFDFYPASAVKGCPAPNSLVTLGEVVYGYFEDGFYVFDGNVAQPIGANKVDRWFASNANLAALQNLIGAPDIASKSIFWLFQSTAATNNQPDTILIYRWDIGRWSTASLSAQWIARVPVPQGTVSFPPNELPLVQGQLQLAAIDPTQRLAYFSGPQLPASIGTKALQITPGRRSYVQGCRPLIDGGLPLQPLLNENGTPLLNENGTPLMSENGTPTITIAMSARDTYQEPESFGVAVGINSMGDCPQRSDGRFHRALATITPQANGSPWNVAYGVDLTAIGSGIR